MALTSNLFVPKTRQCRIYLITSMYYVDVRGSIYIEGLTSDMGVGGSRKNGCIENAVNDSS